jgi:hypothetical protein
MLYALMEGTFGEGVSWKKPFTHFYHLHTLRIQFCHAFLNIQEFKRHMLISVQCASLTFTNGEDELIIQALKIKR